MAHAHIALCTNCSPAAAGLHEMAGHRVTVTPSVKLRYDVIYLVHFYDTSVLFSQLFASRKLRALCWYFHFRFVLIRGVHFVYVTLWLWNIANVRWQLYQSLTSLDPAVSLICRPQLKPRLAFSCGVWSRGAAREWIIFCVWLRRLQRLPSRGPAAAAKKTAIHLAGNSVTALRRAALRVTPHTGIQMETRSRVQSLYCPVVYLSTPRP